MPRRKGRVLERVQLQQMLEEIHAIETFVVIEFDDVPEYQGAMLAMLEEAQEDCLQEAWELEQWWNPRLEVQNCGRSISSFEGDELRTSFRFDALHLRELMSVLDIPRFFWANHSTRRFNGEEAFLLLLRRLGGRETLVHLSAVFDRSAPALSEMYNAVLDHVYVHAAVAMGIELWEDEVDSFARALQLAGCPMANCIGFVDGTMFDIRRPTHGQESMYNGWKRKHKVKYQGVVLPNFLIGDWFGPKPGRANDAGMMGDSRLIPRLQAMQERVGRKVQLYGDAAYPECDVLYSAPKGNNISLEAATFAKTMSSYRESVEWVFGKLGEVWPFVTDVTRKVTGARATGKEDCVAAFLTNMHTCAYGGVGNSYFQTRPPTMRRYKELYARFLDQSNRQTVARLT